MVKNILLLVLLFSQSYLFAGSINNDFRTYYWTMNRTDRFRQQKIDSTISTYPLLLETLREKKGEVGCVIPFLLESKTKSNVRIKIRYKSENCNDLYLKLGSVGECEKLNSSDTICLPLNRGWTTFDQSITVADSYLLNLSIEVSGTKLNDGKIWINHLDIWIDGEKVNNPLTTNGRVVVSLDKDDVVYWGNNTLHNVSFLNKKILAIGETVHGTETMNNIGIEIIKDRIINRNCKLVLLEIPIEQALYINRYLDGDSNFKLDHISTYFDFSVFSYSFVSFIQWLKNYNLFTGEKVYLLGMDWNSIQLMSQIELFDFFYTLNKSLKNKEIEKICISLLNHRSCIKDALSTFDANHGFKEIFNEKESELVRYCLTLVDQTLNSYIRYTKRDTVMYENTQNLMNNLLKAGETVTVYCHLGHANYPNYQEMITFEQLPFGYYMKKAYHDDYSCVGIVAETGNFLTIKPPCIYAIDQLDSSPYNSIEHLIATLNLDSCYLSMEKLTCSDALKIRLLGSANNRNEQFRFIIPKSRMDGVIFIKKVSGFNRRKELTDKTFNMDAILMNAYEQVLRKRELIQADH